MAVSHLWRRENTKAKRDDDFVPPTRLARWKSARMPRRKGLLRFAATALLLGLLFLLLGDGHSWRQSPGPLDDDGLHHGQVDDNSIKFPKLSASLPSTATMRSRNVLFAAASLASAATLLPMACQMALERHNSVHFAFMGVSDIAMTDLLSINGIDKTCSIALHDARPNKAQLSTERRLALAVSRSIRYIDSYMRAKAIIIDSSSSEQDFFDSGVRDAMTIVRSTLITLAEKPETRLSWLTKLDALALAAWNKVRFDILIHSPRTGAGNLQRLLRSLAAADLLGHSPPHLTIELSSALDGPLESFLAGYEWPPSSTEQKTMPQLLSLRRRIVRQRLTEEESSVRFLESFWPSDATHNHVLVLSPNTEVTPHFFHYVKYTLLHYRYSAMALQQGLDSKTMAMSFTLPTTSIDGTHPFTPPQPLHHGDKARGIFFLWQAPASDAVLFLGDKWVELHHYVTQVLDRQHETSSWPALLAKKLASRDQPAWLEYVLQLSRLRSYFTLYPNPQTAQALVGVHSDLPHKPEEYDDIKSNRGSNKKKLAPDQSSGLFDPTSPVDMVQMLPRGAEHQLPSHLPLLSWDGKQKSLSVLRDEAAHYTEQFRSQVGQCSEEQLKLAPKVDKSARDLFCKASKESG
ncbi:hypothetical protein CDD81_2704 [Ophiocordyceps australis]|uniref:Glycosyltransferase 2 n=1 Tax=Ophiocordyceps australis TaxID=1399860 RepID=A0A2C5YDD8_9HYPO|nr:hypothetical protein CDD81_2704 [Ophiocordyceps australis]